MTIFAMVFACLRIILSGIRSAHVLTINFTRRNGTSPADLAGEAMADFLPNVD